MDIFVKTIQNIQTQQQRKSCYSSAEPVQHLSNKCCRVLSGHSRPEGHSWDLAQIAVIKKDGSKGMKSRYGSESQVTWRRKQLHVWEEMGLKHHVNNRRTVPVKRTWETDECVRILTGTCHLGGSSGSDDKPEEWGFYRMWMSFML